MSNGSASGAARLLACPAHLAFPAVHRIDDQYASRGQGIHAFVRNVLAGMPVDDALAHVSDDQRETCRMLDWNKLTGDLEPSSIQTEVSYVLDVHGRTARRVGANMGREYGSLGDYEIPGTLDIEGVRRSDGRIVVRDLKTGYMDVDPAEENAQGLFFGAVKMLMTGASEIEFAIAKLRTTGSIWLDAATYTAWEIDAFVDDLHAALERSKRASLIVLDGGTPNVTEGSHCTYCPAADSCPAKTKLARAMLSTLAPLDVEGAIDAMTDEAAGRAYELVHDRAAPIVERVLDALKERARRAPFPIGEGQELREAPYLKEQLQTSALLELARAKGASDAEIRSCYVEQTIRPIRPCKTQAAKKTRKGSRAA